MEALCSNLRRTTGPLAWDMIYGSASPRRELDVTSGVVRDATIMMPQPTHIFTTTITKQQTPAIHKAMQDAHSLHLAAEALVVFWNEDETSGVELHLVRRDGLHAWLLVQELDD